MRDLILKLIIIFPLIFLYPVFTPSQVPDLPDLALQGSLKTQIEMIRESPHSWKILVNGKTPPENESIRIEVLEGTVQNLSLRSSGNVDFSSLQTIVNDVISPEMTEDDPNLSSRAREIISNIQNELFFSAASGWEITIKV